MMLSVSKTALGIHISENRINLVLLKKSKSGIKFVKSACGPVPDGAIEKGNVKDVSTLSKAIKELKAKNKMDARRAAVSLFVRPMLVQIMDIPKQIPTNVGQFVQNEVKNYVMLPGKNIALDYCGIDSRGQSGFNRLFVVAADGQRVYDLAKACNRTGLNTEAIEPSLLAYARAFYGKKIAGKFDCNVLIALLEADVLTVCVFRNQNMDFVRTKKIEKEKTEPAKFALRLAEEINTVIKFYDSESPDNRGKWEITIAGDDSMLLPQDAEKSLQAAIANAVVRVRTAQNAYQDTPVADSEHIGDDKPSPVAVGLAMKLLGTDGTIKINLLPEEPPEVKSAKKDALIAANITAAILVLMILVAGGLSFMTTKTNKKIVHKKRTEMSRSTNSLLKEQEMLEARIEQLSEGPGQMNSIENLHHDIDWTGLLNDVRNATPRTARITRLLSKDALKMSLEGQTLSYESVHLFVNMLNKSEHIDSASLVEAEKDEDDGGLVRYSINCSLVPQKRKPTGVN